MNHLVWVYYFFQSKNKMPGNLWGFEMLLLIKREEMVATGNLFSASPPPPARACSWGPAYLTHGAPHLLVNSRRLTAPCSLLTHPACFPGADLGRLAAAHLARLWGDGQKPVPHLGADGVKCPSGDWWPVGPGFLWHPLRCHVPDHMGLGVGLVCAGCSDTQFPALLPQPGARAASAVPSP